MPLYDGDMVNLLTPDGRAVTMPSGLAANFPGLQPFPIPAALPPDAAGNSPPALPPTATPVPGPAPGGPQEGPITDPSQLPPLTGSPGAAPQGPVTSPAQDPGVPRRPAPEPSPTKAQLIKEGPAGTLAAQNAAIDTQQAAIDRSAQVEADAATQEGHAMAARDARTQQILDERAQQAKANEAELNARIQARDQLADQIAKTRIDRSVDHPIWAQIGLIMSMVGTAMTRRPGEAWNDPAYNTLQQLIDKKVAGQMADIDVKRSALAQMNVGVTEQRQHNVDRITEIDARKDAAIQQAQQAVQTIAMQMKSPAALAKAAEVNATLEEKRADLRGQAGQRYQDQMNVEAARAQTLQMHRETLGFQYANLAATERERMATVAAQLLKEGKAEAAAKAKAVAEGGLFDPRTRDSLLNPAGQAKFKQADQLEAAARQQQDPALATRQRQQAEDLRMSARINDSVVVDPKVATKLREHIDTAQNATDQIGDIVAKLEKDPSAFNREQWAGIATQMSNLANVYQKTIGERISVRAFDQTMKHILEFDPDSYFHRAVNQGRALESLKQLKGIVADDINSDLGAQGVKTDWKPVPRGAGDRDATLSIDEKTARETADDRSLGYLNLGRYTGLQDQAKEEAFSDAAARPGSEAGLSPNATTHIKALAARAETAGDAEHDRIVQALAAPISDGLRDGGRNSVSIGMLEVLRNTAPAVYDDVVKTLPATDQKEIRDRDALVRKAARVPNSPSGFDPAAAAAAQAERDSSAAAAAARSERVRAEQRAKFGDLGTAR